MWTLYLYLFSVTATLLLTAYAAISDFRSFTIPNWISLVIFSLYPIAVFTSPVYVDWMWSLAVFGCVFVIGFLLFIFGGLGGGDVKLLSALSLWAGLDGIGPFLIVTALAGGVLVPLFILRSAIQSDEKDRGFSGKIRSQLRAKLNIPYGIAIATGSLPVFYQYAINTNLFG